jgi:hypothetical protein
MQQRGGNRTKALITAAAVAGLLALAGCGADGKEGNDRPTTGGSTTAPEPVVDRAADRKIARSALLSLDDFSSGWTEKDDDDNSSSEAKCRAISDARSSATAWATAPSFTKDEATQVDNTNYLFADETKAKESFTAIADRDTRRCLEEAFEDDLDVGEDVEVGDVETGRVAINPLGDERDAARFTVPVSSDGSDRDLHVDIVFVRTGRAIAFVVFTDVFRAFDDDLREELTGKVLRPLSEGAI